MRFKYKFLSFLTASIFISLLIFNLVSSRIFIEDKTTSAKEMNLVLATSLANRVKEQSLNVNLSEIKKLFQDDDSLERLLIDSEGTIQIGESKWVGKKITERLSPDFAQKINKSSFSTGVIEVLDSEQKKQIVAYANVADASLSGQHFVLVLQSEAMLSRASLLLLVKSIFLFIAILGGALSFGLMLVSHLTDSLEKLEGAMSAFGSGKFDLKINVQSNDEIGTLSQHFNKMTKQIKDLLAEQKETARVEQELAIAQKVQEMFFPKSDFQSGQVSLAALFEPASECGGDWWYYFKKNQFLTICIGDVTGHGFSSALLTSSVRTAFSLIEKMEDCSPSNILYKLNQAIFETVKGQLQMTFLALQINTQTGEVVYANGSHEPSLLLRNGIAKKKSAREIEVLDSRHGSRLGENHQSSYQQSSIQLEKGDRLVLFTDGVYDVKSDKGESWNERVFLKNILLSSEKATDPKKLISDFTLRVKQARNGSLLRDDLSVVVVDFTASNSQGEQGQ